jgi:glycosyltransferase involved in cell wall biosynthesis
MSDRPLVSVIIPTFNRAAYLPETLQSLQRQTLSDFEVIVVDDGSTDNTAPLVKERYPSVRYFYQENAGPAAARNRGLCEARGRFVSFLDSDDLWRPRFLEANSDHLLSNPDVDVVFCRFETMDADKRILPGHRKRPYSGDVTARLFASTFITTPSVMIRREAIDEVGGFNSGLLTTEDYDLWLRLSLRHRFGYVDEPLCLRRSHPGTQSRKGSPVPLIRKARLLERYYARPEFAAKIPAELARRRLGKVYYTAGKASQRRRCYTEACELLRRSLHYRPRSPKAWLWYALACLRRNSPHNCASGYLDPVD